VSDPGVVEAAGGVLWRESARGREIVLVHRPRYDDWSLPKGKRKPGEHLLLTAAREVEEETGHRPRVGPFLAQYSYPVTAAGKPAVKVVKYWAMAEAGGRFRANDEVDKILWLGAEEAMERSQFPIDRQVLKAFVQLPPRTSTLLVVRNGSAGTARGRSSRERPLDRRGRGQADALVPVLARLGITRLLSTGSARCIETLTPYATSADLEVHIDDGLERQPDVGAATAQRLLGLATKGEQVAVCAEGEVVARLVGALGPAPGADPHQDAVIRKGGWYVVHVADGQLIAVEREEAAA